MNLHNYDLIIVNSSGGKDSICSLFQICEMAKKQNYSKTKIVVSHQDLGKVEWKGVKELVEKQSEFFGVKTYFSKRRNFKGYEENMLEYVDRRGMWPSNTQRWCTSDFKRGPGQRVVTMLTKEMGKCKVLYVFGFRKDESPARSKKTSWKKNKKLTTKKRLVYDYLPIHSWSTKKVWKTIKENNLPYHFAYDLGMPRLSCVFCVFSPFDALVIAGKENPLLLNEYVDMEKKIGHTFRKKLAIKEVQDAINNNYQPKKVDSWVM